MPKVLQVSSYNFTSEDKLFMDTNIWLYLYGPQRPRDPRVSTYSQMLKRILNAKSRVYVDVLVISEFINTYARIKWNLVRKGTERFKTFRNSSDFKPIAKEIANSTKRVMSHCTCTESGFGSLKIGDLLDAYSVGNSDFNDQVIATLCKSKKLTLITHDGDFKDRELSILTANPRLLN